MISTLIDELLASGLSEAQIAEKVSTSQASINRIRRGKQKPLYELGIAIVELHKNEIVLKQVA